MAESKKKKVTIVSKKKTQAAEPAAEHQQADTAAGTKKKPERKKKGLLDLPSLLDFPAGVAESAREVWMAGIGALSTVEEMGAELFQSLVDKGERWEQISRERLLGAAKGVSAAAEGAKTTAGNLGQKPFEWSDKVEAQIERMVEDAVEGVLHRIGVPTHEEVQELIRRVDALSGKVDVLSARMKTQPKAVPEETAAPAEAVSTTYMVVPGESGWSVQREGDSRSASVHPNKAEAVTAGRDLARGHAPSRLVVHKQDGTVQDTFTYDG